MGSNPIAAKFENYFCEGLAENNLRSRQNVGRKVAFFHQISAISKAPHFHYVRDLIRAGFENILTKHGAKSCFFSKLIGWALSNCLFCQISGFLNLLSALYSPIGGLKAGKYSIIDGRAIYSTLGPLTHHGYQAPSPINSPHLSDLKPTRLSTRSTRIYTRPLIH